MKLVAATLRAQAAALRAVAAALDAQADVAEREPVSDPYVGREDVGVDAATWRRVCRTGELTGAALIGRAYRAKKSDVERWLESRRVQPRPGPVRAPRVRAANDPDEEEVGDEFDRRLRQR